MSNVRQLVHALELAIFDWVRSEFPPLLEEIESQLVGIAGAEPTYTNGGGFFLSLHPAPGAVPLPASFLAKFASLEGPTISSPELQLGASTTIHVNPHGYFSSLEIWSHAGDYPRDRHPAKFSLSRPAGTYIDLRGMEAGDNA